MFNERVSTKLANAIKNVYKSVKATVRYKNNFSPFIDSNIGAKQWDPSSSLLFLYFVKEIVHNLNDNIDGLFELKHMKMFIILFADDAVLFAHSPKALQSLLNDLSVYSK